MKKDFLFVLKSFFVWRVTLFLVAAASAYLIPKFGATFPYWDRVLTITGLPNWLWGFGNFDGVHYLRIAQNGYTSEFTNAFFPLYPILIKGFSIFFPRTEGLDLRIYTDPSYFYAGLFLGNLFFAMAIYFFYKLLRIDFSEIIAKKSTLFLLVFPVSFYFGSIYTESLFLLLAAISIYLIRKQKYLYSGIFIALATATRIVGIFLILVYLIELVKKRKMIKVSLSEILGLVIAPLGLACYSLYLYSKFGDFFYFLSVQPKFGAERSSSLVLLPQVIYRYIKIFFNVPVASLGFFNAFLELAFTVIILGALLYFYKKLRLSYFLFSISAVLLPTLTGTLSSMPRYVLISFLIIPLIVQKIERFYKFSIVLMILLQVFLLSLFIRGYWVS